MKIELKSVKVVNSMSEETICFSANIFIDNKKVGYAKNHGQGGPTEYYFDKPEIRDAFETYCSSLPDVQYKDFSFKMDGELYIDQLVQEYCQKKQDKRIAKAREKSRAFFASKGFPVLLEVVKGGSIVWVGVKSEEDVETSIKELAKKHKVQENDVKKV